MIDDEHQQTNAAPLNDDEGQQTMWHLCLMMKGHRRIQHPL